MMWFPFRKKKPDSETYPIDRFETEDLNPDEIELIEARAKQHFWWHERPTPEMVTVAFNYYASEYRESKKRDGELNQKFDELNAKLNRAKQEAGVVATMPHEKVIDAVRITQKTESTQEQILEQLKTLTTALTSQNIQILSKLENISDRTSGIDVLLERTEKQPTALSQAKEVVKLQAVKNIDRRTLEIDTQELRNLIANGISSYGIARRHLVPSRMGGRRFRNAWNRLKTEKETAPKILDDSGDLTENS